MAVACAQQSDAAFPESQWAFPVHTTVQLWYAPACKTQPPWSLWLYQAAKRVGAESDGTCNICHRCSFSAALLMQRCSLHGLSQGHASSSAARRASEANQKCKNVTMCCGDGCNHAGPLQHQHVFPGAPELHAVAGRPRHHTSPGVAVPAHGTGQPQRQLLCCTVLLQPAAAL